MQVEILRLGKYRTDLANREYNPYWDYDRIEYMTSNKEDSDTMLNNTGQKAKLLGWRLAIIKLI